MSHKELCNSGKKPSYQWKNSSHNWEPSTSAARNEEVTTAEKDTRDTRVTMCNLILIKGFGYSSYIELEPVRIYSIYSDLLAPSGDQNYIVSAISKISLRPRNRPRSNIWYFRGSKSVVLQRPITFYTI